MPATPATHPLNQGLGILPCPFQQLLPLCLMPDTKLGFQSISVPRCLSPHLFPGRHELCITTRAAQSVGKRVGEIAETGDSDDYDRRQQIMVPAVELDAVDSCNIKQTSSAEAMAKWRMFARHIPDKSGAAG